MIITIRPEGSRPSEISTTNIRKGSKSIVASDLKAGDAVQVRYVERDGKAMAQSILVKGGPRKEAKKAEPK